MTNKNTVIKLEKIKKSYILGNQEIMILKGLDLNVKEGEFVAIMGESGGGKSTLLNAVAGTFFVDEGTIRLADKNITRWPEHKRARLVGRVFQDPFSGTAPSMTIAENLAMAARRGLRRGLLPALTSTKKNALPYSSWMNTPPPWILKVPIRSFTLQNNSLRKIV